MNATLLFAAFSLAALFSVRSRFVDVEEKIVYGVIILGIVGILAARFTAGAFAISTKELLLVVAVLALPLVATSLVPAARPTAEVISAMAAIFAIALGLLLRRDFLDLSEGSAPMWLWAGLGFGIPLVAVLAYHFAPAWDRPEAPSTLIFIVLGALSSRSRVLFWGLWVYLCAVVFFFIDQRSTLLLLFAIPFVELAFVLRRRSRFLARIAIISIPVAIVGATLLLATLQVGRFALVQQGLDGSSLGRFEELEVLAARFVDEPVAVLTGLGAGLPLVGGRWTRDFVHIGFADFLYTHGLIFGTFLGILLMLGFSTVMKRQSNTVIVYGILAAMMNFLLYNHRAYFIDVFIIGCLIGVGMDRATPRVTVGSRPPRYPKVGSG